MSRGRGKFSRVLRQAFWFLSAAPQSCHHQLAALRELDDHLLKDIGLTRQEAARGAASQRPAVTGEGASSVGGKAWMH